MCRALSAHGCGAWPTSVQAQTRAQADARLDANATGTHLPRLCDLPKLLMAGGVTLYVETYENIGCLVTISNIEAPICLSSLFVTVYSGMQTPDRGQLSLHFLFEAVHSRSDACEC